MVAKEMGGQFLAWKVVLNDVFETLPVWFPDLWRISIWGMLGLVTATAFVATAVDTANCNNVNFDHD
jgi:hypothetical protein